MVHSGVLFIFERWRSAPNYAEPGVTYQSPSLDGPASEQAKRAGAGQNVQRLSVLGANRSVPSEVVCA